MRENGSENSIYTERCRLCLSDLNDGKIHLYGEIGRGMRLVKKIKDCILLSVSEDDDLPKSVCAICTRRLCDFSDFKQQCVETDCAWRSLLNAKSSSNDPQVTKEVNDAPQNSICADEGLIKSADAWKKKCLKKVSFYQDNNMCVSNIDSHPSHEPVQVNLKQSQLELLRNIKIEETAVEKASDFEDQAPVEDEQVVNNSRLLPEQHVITDLVQVKQEVEGESDYDVHNTEEHLSSELCQFENDADFDFNRSGKQFDESTKIDQDESARCSRQDSTVWHGDLIQSKVWFPHTAVCQETRCGMDNSFLIKLPLLHQTSQVRNERESTSSTVDCTPSSSDNTNMNYSILLPTLPENIIQSLTEKQRKFLVRSKIPRPYACDLCKRKFDLERKLERHKRRHLKPKKHVCHFCGKGFVEKGDCRNHTLTHTGEKPFSCSVCGKQFRLRSQVDAHMKTHNGDKPYVCEFCGKSFSYNTRLTSHKRLHTNEKPYQCSYCLKCFRSRDALKDHIRCHTGEIPYRCKLCPAGFSRKPKLLKHMSLFHSEVQMEVPS